MSESQDGSPAAAASQMASVVTASLLPIGCMYGCVVGLLWLIGGGVIGFLIGLVLRHHL